MCNYLQFLSIFLAQTMKIVILTNILGSKSENWVRGSTYWEYIQYIFIRFNWKCPYHPINTHYSPRFKYFSCSNFGNGYFDPFVPKTGIWGPDIYESRILVSTIIAFIMLLLEIISILIHLVFCLFTLIFQNQLFLGKWGSIGG